MATGRGMNPRPTTALARHNQPKEGWVGLGGSG